MSKGITYTVNIYRVYYVTDNYSDPNREWDPLDPTDPYNDCPYCGSSDTDGNHCYDCDEDF